MKEELVTFDTAKLAKEKGFDISQTKGYYSHGDSKLVLSENYNEQKYLPTQSLIQKWLREVHNLITEASYDYSKKKYIANSKKLDKGYQFSYSTYEEALEVAMYSALETIK